MFQPLKPSATHSKYLSLLHKFLGGRSAVTQSELDAAIAKGCAELGGNYENASPNDTISGIAYRWKLRNFARIFHEHGGVIISASPTVVPSQKSSPGIPGQQGSPGVPGQ